MNKGRGNRAETSGFNNHRWSSCRQMYLAIILFVGIFAELCILDLAYLLFEFDMGWKISRFLLSWRFSDSSLKSFPLFVQSRSTWHFSQFVSPLNSSVTHSFQWEPNISKVVPLVSRHNSLNQTNLGHIINSLRHSAIFTGCWGTTHMKILGSLLHSCGFSRLPQWQNSSEQLVAPQSVIEFSFLRASYNK